MDWRTASLVTLALWSSYMVFGGKATDIHGSRVSMFFEGVAMMSVAIFGIYGHLGDFTRITLRSSALGLTMGFMSAAGLYIQLYALEIAPKRMPEIAMISGSWPAITAVLACIFVGSSLQPQQWLGVLAVAGGLVLVNWTR